MGSQTETKVLDGPAALAETAAGAIVDAAVAAIAARGRFTLVLSGGATPRETYERLANPPFRDRIDWQRTLVFFGDERRVAPDHRDSNYQMAHAALLSKVPIPPESVFRIRGDAEDPEVAAAEYARAIAGALGLRRGELPRFDLVLLGLGVDGHAASLFPGSPVLKEVFRTVAAVHATAAAVPQRFTLTLPVLNAAAEVIFLVSGPEKAKVVKAAFTDQSTLPAAMVRPANGRLCWLLDRDAAALLKTAAER
jgi:6-phosphogluconolactonase